MSLSKNRCSLCNNELRINDSVILLKKSKYCHESCYRNLLFKKYQNAGLTEQKRLNHIKSILDDCKLLLSLDTFKIKTFNRITKECNLIMIKLNLIRDNVSRVDIGFVRLQKIKLSLNANFKKLKKTIFEYVMKKKVSSKEELQKHLSNDLRNQLLDLVEDLQNITNCLEPLVDEARNKVRTQIEDEMEKISEKTKKY